MKTTAPLAAACGLALLQSLAPWHAVVVTAAAATSDHHASSDDQTRYAACKTMCKRYFDTRLDKKMCQPALNLMPRPGVFKSCVQGRIAAFEQTCLPTCMGTGAEDDDDDESAIAEKPAVMDSYEACKREAKRASPNHQFPWCRRGYEATYPEVTEAIRAEAGELFGSDAVVEDTEQPVINEEVKVEPVQTGDGLGSGLEAGDISIKDHSLESMGKEHKLNERHLTIEEEDAEDMEEATSVVINPVKRGDGSTGEDTEATSVVEEEDRSQDAQYYDDFDGQPEPAVETLLPNSPAERTNASSQEEMASEEEESPPSLRATSRERPPEIIPSDVPEGSVHSSGDNPRVLETQTHGYDRKEF